MKKAIAAVIIFLITGSVCVSAQESSTTREKEFVSAYDAYIRKSMEALPDIPAIAIVVIKDDRPIFIRAYGTADKETGTKADADTMFYIASSTKSFTALAAAMLDKEGKIKIAEPVNKYAANIRFKESLPEKITIRDLLTHTSGLRNDALTFRMAFSGESDPAAMSRVFGEATTFNEANFGKYRYDNLGYNIYAVLLQNHLKMKWQDLLQNKLFGPLGMKHTSAYISKAQSRKWNVAPGYMYDVISGKIVRSPLAKTDSNMQSAGGIFASVSDIGKWLNMNMNEGRLNGKQVIPADILRAAHTGYTKTTREGEPFTGEGEYGLGWQIGKFRNEKVIYHHGGFPGYGSHISFLPEKKIAIAVLVNEGFVGARTGHVLATFGYDWWLGSANSTESYEKRLSDTVKGYGEWKQAAAASAAERAKRVSQLSKPAAEYAGTYRNELFGNIMITPKGNDLEVKMGNMNATATPFTEKETIRVELVPGQGEVIRFMPNADGKFASIMFRGFPFVRLDTSGVRPE